MNNYNITNIYHIYETIFKHYVPNYEQYLPLLSYMCALTTHMVKHRGLPETLKRLKSFRLFVTRYLSGKPLRVLPGEGVTKDGLPKALGPLKFFIRRKTLWDVRVILTLLNAGRAIELPTKMETNSITQEWKGRIDPKLIGFIPVFLSRNGIGQLSTEWSQYHWSTKSGPNGHAMATSHLDAFTLTDEQIELIATIAGPDLQDNIEEIKDMIERPSVPPKGARLTPISDKEGKTRVIAILDYWTQTALLPLHTQLMGCLERIKQDCTYDQSKFKTLLKFNGQPFYSLDLSNATDRFPVLLQEQLLIGLIGIEKAKAWRKLMTERDYITPNGEAVRYRTGQPMGCYSSWAAFTLCHHLTVQYAQEVCRLKGIPQGTYCMLGDDIVIQGKDLAEAYQDILKTLDVPISEAKTHISSHCYEFAKRWILSGVEVSPLPAQGIIEATKKFYLLNPFYDEQVQRGWYPTDGKAGPGIDQSRYSLFSVSIKHKRLREWMTRKAQLSQIGINLLRIEGEGVYEVPPQLNFDLRGSSQSWCLHMNTFLIKVKESAAYVGTQGMQKAIEDLRKYRTISRTEILKSSGLVSQYDASSFSEIHPLTCVIELIFNNASKSLDKLMSGTSKILNNPELIRSPGLSQVQNRDWFRDKLIDRVPDPLVVTHSRAAHQIHQAKANLALKVVQRLLFSLRT